jgi:hypothetical protein
MEYPTFLQLTRQVKTPFLFQDSYHENATSSFFSFKPFYLRLQNNYTNVYNFFEKNAKPKRSFVVPQHQLINKNV